MNQVPPVQVGILLAWFKLSLPVGDREDTVLNKNLSLRTESTGLSQRPLSIAREAATGRLRSLNEESPRPENEEPSQERDAQLPVGVCTSP